MSCGANHVIVLAQARVCNNDPHAVDKGTIVFSWGMVANGRLGHGIPKQERESKFWKKNRVNATEHCESKPRIIAALSNEPIIDISAGEHHSLAVSQDGRVFAWGSNRFGQCGVFYDDARVEGYLQQRRHRNREIGTKEDNSPGFWNDIWLPCQLSEFGPKIGVRIVSVSSGSIQSAAIDSYGKLYTWGGGGDNYCLGHGDSFHYKNGIDLSSDSFRRKFLAMAGYLDIPAWGSPREVECLKGERIRYVNLGTYHNVAISESGNLYVWGRKCHNLNMVRSRCFMH